MDIRSPSLVRLLEHRIQSCRHHRISTGFFALHCIAAYLFTGPEHRPFVPRRDSGVSQPSAEVWVSNGQRYHRRSERGSLPNFKKRCACSEQRHIPMHSERSTRLSADRERTIWRMEIIGDDVHRLEPQSPQEPSGDLFL